MRSTHDVLTPENLRRLHVMPEAFDEHAPVCEVPAAPDGSGHTHKHSHAHPHGHAHEQHDHASPAHAEGPAR